MWTVLWYNRKHKVLVRRKKILYTQGKFSEKSFLILQQHIVVIKLLMPLVPRGPNTITAQPWLRLYSLQYTSEYFIAINIFYCVTFIILSNWCCSQPYGLSFHSNLGSLLISTFLFLFVGKTLSAKTDRINHVNPFCRFPLTFVFVTNGELQAAYELIQF